ncbi:hypothetical protein SDC9_168490 [bioreactor metagenome]|uniref:Uncharacterized protein n=1 Tax=bioreactor metagenome TaxID=1076179 RepID=A0A645G2P4_9ZZZZ
MGADGIFAFRIIAFQLFEQRIRRRLVAGQQQLALGFVKRIGRVFTGIGRRIAPENIGRIVIR